MMKSILPLITMLVWGHLLCAQEAGSVDEELEECLEVAGTTSEMIDCQIRAAEAWDKELNKYYKLYLSKLNEEGKAVLKEAQREWIVYRDKEYRLIDSHYLSRLQGTMWHPVAASEKMEIVKERALKLKGYYEDLQID